jgi:predicted membrane channel-forming protein YqfA (hemolysin III family)
MTWSANEWFVVSVTFAGWMLTWLLPRRFDRSSAVLFVLFGAYFGVVFDHALAGVPIDYYDINDSKSFEFMDFMTYLMYGPISYLFLYLYDWLRVPGRLAPFYVLAWTAFGMLLEGIGARFGVFEYKNGYDFDYSSLVYFTLQLLTLALYYYRKSVVRRSGKEYGESS